MEADRRDRARSHVLALILAGILATTGVSFGAGTGPIPAEASEAAPPRPAHVHGGTCENLDPEPAYPLADLTIAEDASGRAHEDGASIPAAMSVTTIDAPLADLLATPHVINVHESREAMADYVSCGAISGVEGPDGLAIGLAPHHPHDDFSGVAWLRSDGDRTIVAAFLTQGLVPSREPTPEAAAANDREEVTVTLGGPSGEFTITASESTFRVGVPYRFVVTNAGRIPHELMIVPVMPAGGMDMEGLHHMALGSIHEEELPPGASKTLDIVFTAPAAAGELEFACHVPGHYEGGMRLPIEVVP